MFGSKMVGAFLPGLGVPELIMLMVIISIIALPVIIIAIVVGKAANSKESRPSEFGLFCPKCGGKSDEGANFCRWCGARLS